MHNVSPDTICVDARDFNLASVFLKTYFKKITLFKREKTDCDTGYLLELKSFVGI